MDELSQSLKRQALAGDPDALRKYRTLSIRSGMIPHSILLVLATLNYPPARELFTHQQIEGFRGNSSTIDLIYEQQDGFDATCIAYKVAAAMIPLILEQDGLEHILNVCVTTDDNIFLSGTDLMQVLHDANNQIRQLSDPEFLLDIGTRAQQAYIGNKEPWNRGWQYKDPQVYQFYQTHQRLEAIDQILSVSCTEPELNRGGDFFHLNLAIRGMASLVVPPLGGMGGSNNLDYSIHQIRNYLFGMNYDWQRNAFVEAIFNYYLI